MQTKLCVSLWSRRTSLHVTAHQTPPLTVRGGKAAALQTTKLHCHLALRFTWAGLCCKHGDLTSAEQTMGFVVDVRFLFVLFKMTAAKATWSGWSAVVSVLIPPEEDYCLKGQQVYTGEPTVPLPSGKMDDDSDEWIKKLPQYLHRRADKQNDI